MSEAFCLLDPVLRAKHALRHRLQALRDVLAHPPCRPLRVFCHQRCDLQDVRLVLLVLLADGEDRQIRAVTADDLQFPYDF